MWRDLMEKVGELMWVKEEGGRNEMVLESKSSQEERYIALKSPIER